MAVLALACTPAWALNCGSTVTTTEGSQGTGTTASAGTGGSSAGAGGSTGTSMSCADTPPLCADDCGSDYFPEQAECVGGAWVCPPGTINPADCPSGTCWGAPLSCEQCGPAGWECQATVECATCDTLGPQLMCATCNGATSPAILGGCECTCDDAGQYQCSLAPGCCNEDIDCGDFVYTPCVDHVCKPSVGDGCWKDAECPPGEICVGAVVCPCGFDCDAPDSPGTCQP